MSGHTGGTVRPWKYRYANVVKWEQHQTTLGEPTIQLNVGGQKAALTRKEALDLMAGLVEFLANTEEKKQ